MAVYVMTKRYQWMVLIRYQCLALFMSFWVLQVQAIESLGVIYPEVREPYSRVYEDIIQGIRSNFSGTLYEFPLNGNVSSIIKKHSKDRSEPEAYIVLGGKSLGAVRQLNRPIFAALTQAPTPGTLSGVIVLTPSAEVYLDNLFSLYPTVPTVHVVYRKDRHQTLINDAVDFLKSRNKFLNALPAADIRESARAFRQILQEAKHGDAVWLISDSGLIDTASLDSILDSAWDKKLAVFSSNPAFAKRGALFAIYPDNVGIGKSLVDLVVEVTGEKEEVGTVAYLKDVKLAYNERTGNHIGIRLTTDMRNSIELILPEF